MDRFKDVKRIIFKFGTNVLRNDDKEVSLSRMYSFIEDISKLHRQGKEIIIVTSGAVGLGASKAHIDDTDDIVVKQACAAIGQTGLMSIYENGFEKYGILCAQILLTEDDFAIRKRYLSLNNVLNELLRLRVIPVINQNDTVSTLDRDKDENIFEVCFEDNDKLSALVASKIDADLLVILSDIDALYNDNPKENPNAEKISLVEGVTPEIEQYAHNASQGGRGGMKTKLEGAKIVTKSGGSVIIANGKTPEIIKKIFSCDDIGTLFLPVEQLSGKKRWIGYATNITGQIRINDGAKKALAEKESSLLPIGIIDVTGKFKRGDAVLITDSSGKEFAKGLSNYDSEDCRQIKGLHSDRIFEILGHKNYDAVVTRDNIVIL
ncbi:MAG: glutamate 5-kinase [Candidatus Gastranaerophilaceae bacterium]